MCVFLHVQHEWELFIAHKTNGEIRRERERKTKNAFKHVLCDCISLAGIMIMCPLVYYSNDK